MKNIVKGIVAASIALGTAVPFAMADTSSHSWFQLNVTVNGKTLSTPQAFTQGTETYVPIFYMDQALNKLGYKTAWNGRIGRWTVTSSSDETAVLNAWANDLGSGNTGVILNDNVLTEIGTVTATDPANHHTTTYAPVSFVSDFLKSLNAGTWTQTGNVLNFATPVTVTNAVATNGTITVTFNQALAAAPTASDFSVTGTLGQATSSVTVSQVSVSSDMTTVTLTIPKITPGQPVPHYSVSYQGQTAVNAYERVVAVNDGTPGETSKTLSVGQTVVVSGVSDQCTPMPSITFQSDNPSVATVSADGTVTAIAPGVAHITATDSKGYQADVPFTVTVQ